MFLDDLQRRFQDMQAKANVRAVFGDVMELDGRKVIPVASVQYGFGMGGGIGPKPGEGEAPGGGAPHQTVQGGGGGAGVRVEPIALIEVANGKLKVEPIINVTRLATMAMILAAWSIFWITRTLRAASSARKSSA